MNHLLTDRAATVETFLTRIRNVNPFTDNRITGPSADDLDVPDLHAEPFRRLTSLAFEACERRRGLGAVLWGEAGIGKSHLLSRLVRWAQYQEQAYAVYVHNLQSSPANAPTALLRAVVNSLIDSRINRFGRTRLIDMIRLAILTDESARPRLVSWDKVHWALVRVLHQHAERGPADAALVDRTVPEILFRLLRSVYRQSEGKEDGATAMAAVRWLRGELLNAEQAALLGLQARQNQLVCLEDAQQVKQVLVTLTRLAGILGRPFLLCFDQVDNLEAAQFSALSRFLEALLDSSPNLLVVTSGVKATLVRWRDERVIQDSSWDRLAQYEFTLQRITAEEGRPLLEVRLQAFLNPYRDIPEVAALIEADPLFPLGSDWFEKKTAEQVEFRPRDILTAGREGWYHEQQRLAALDADWLTTWTVRHSEQVSSPRPQRIDVRIAEALNAAEERRIKEGMPPALNELLCDMVFDCLEECCTRLEDYGTATVIRSEQTNPRPSYDLLVQHHAHGSRWKTSLVFALGLEHGNASYAVLRRLADDDPPPRRVLLVTDPKGLPLGDAGKKLLEELQQRPGCEFREIHLSLEYLAQIEALHSVRLQARAGELRLDTGESIDEATLLARFHDQGRFRFAPILEEVLDPLPEHRQATQQAELSLAGSGIGVPAEATLINEPAGDEMPPPQDRPGWGE